MRILVLESNLMWSSRLSRSLRDSAFEVSVASSLPIELSGFDLAIINLASSTIGDDVARLRSSGVRILAHVGHKERELHDLGRELGIERLATNSELTWKIRELVSEMAALREQSSE